jgi:hypothetical protein
VDDAIRVDEHHPGDDTYDNSSFPGMIRSWDGIQKRSVLCKFSIRLPTRPLRRKEVAENADGASVDKGEWESELPAEGIEDILLLAGNATVAIDSCFERSSTSVAIL